MAFMPEDVLNKNFTATQFRRGYDEQEVDDFLDEVVVELRRLSSEGDELRAQLKACRESKGITLAKDAAAVPAADDDHEAAQCQAATGSAAVAEPGTQDRIATAEASAEQAEKDAAARIAKAKAGAEQSEAQAVERVKA